MILNVVVVVVEAVVRPVDAVVVDVLRRGIVMILNVNRDVVHALHNEHARPEDNEHSPLEDNVRALHEENVHLDNRARNELSVVADVVALHEVVEHVDAAVVEHDETMSMTSLRVIWTMTMTTMKRDVAVDEVEGAAVVVVADVAVVAEEQKRLHHHHHLQQAAVAVVVAVVVVSLVPLISKSVAARDWVRMDADEKNSIVNGNVNCNESVVVGKLYATNVWVMQMTAKSVENVVDDKQQQRIVLNVL